MENASKALIIAGAILLSILLISLGIMVYNNAKGTISDANIDQEKIQAFNTKISQYCGTKKSGTTINSLMDAIAASNGSQPSNGGHFINYNASGAADGANTSDTKVLDRSSRQKITKNSQQVTYPVFDNNHKYNATYQTDANGYIDLVTITIP